MKWAWTKPRWRLLLCAIGLHNWHYFCAGRNAVRDTARECFHCGASQYLAGKNWWMDV